MIKRTIEVSKEPAHLSVKLDQLIIEPHEQPLEARRSIPLEDVGVILVDQRQCSYSHSALAKIADSGAVLIVCAGNHLPTGVLLPLSDHTLVRWRTEEQIAALNRKPLCKRLWRQIVREKIRGQARNLDSDTHAARRLTTMVREVRSGDPTNVEAQAARLYWSEWAPPLDNGGRFRRDLDGGDPLNAMLNYGYAVMRAAVARAIVAAGLLPMLGFKHRSRSNNFALADDLVEPLRPIVDQRARRLYEGGSRELSRVTKAGLLDLLTTRVRTGDDQGPLMVHLHRYVSSLVACFETCAGSLLIPSPVAPGHG